MATIKTKRYFSSGPSDKPDDGYTQELKEAVLLFLKKGGVITKCADGQSGYVNSMSSKRNMVIGKKKTEVTK